MAERVVIFGGGGQIGTILARHFHGRGEEVIAVSRRPGEAPWRTAVWDGRTRGSWAGLIEGARLVLNLAGRSVDCRYTARNREEILESRLLATKLVGEAVARAADPPKLWMNASTATIYRHALDRAMDERTGEIGGGEPGAPETWRFSIDVATRWEREFFDAAAPRTRRIALRSAMTMSPDAGGVFDVLLRLARLGLGGAAGSGNQYVAWIHDGDFVRAIDFLAEREEISGAVNLCAPRPLPNRDFMKALREAAGMRFGLPAAEWMLEIGAFVLRTESELLLKSRRVVPGRLVEAGFEFRFPDWPEAARDLVRRRRASG
jgi:uncharacterized protein (TIGR01777 family)